MIRRISVYVILVVACLISIVPFAITILASLKTMPEIVQGVLAWPESPNWGNYAQAWRQALLDADVVTDVRADTIRFGFGIYQDEADVAELAGRCARAVI